MNLQLAIPNRTLSQCLLERLTQLLARAPTTQLEARTFSTPWNKVSPFFLELHAPAINNSRQNSAAALDLIYPVFFFSGGGKAQVGYQKTSAQHTYGAGALNIKASTEVPKVKENLVYGKADGSGTSQYGTGAMGIESAVNAPKIKHEGLSAVDKTVEQVHNA